MKYVPDSYYDNSNQGRIQDYDILICKDGALTGKVALFRKAHFPFEKAMVNEHVFILRSDNIVTQQFLFSILFSNSGQELLKANITGAAQGGLNRDNLLNIKLPVPSKDIQEKIIEAISAINDNEEKAKLKISESRLKIDDIVLEAYKTYDKIKLGQLVTTNPSKSEVTNLDSDTLVSFIEMSSVSNDGYIETKIDAPYSHVKKGGYTYFKDDDIIVAKITPCMENGKCALAVNLTNGIGFGSSEFHVFRVNSDKILTKYLFALLNRNVVREDAEKNMTGASGHRRVPISFYEQLEIPVPSITEQQKIVSKIETLENQIKEALKILKAAPKLKEDVLKKYL